MGRLGGRRILMLVENSNYTSDWRVRGEARALRDAGFVVSVIGRRPKGGRWHEVIDGNHVYQFSLPADGQGFLGYLYEYGYALVVMSALSLYVLLRHGFDVVHAANPPDLLFLIAVPYKLLGKRFVFDHHDLAPEVYDVREGGQGHPLVRRVLLAVERISCQMADLVIEPNQSYKAVDMARAGVPEKRIAVVRNGPNLERLRQTEPLPGLIRQGKTTIVYLGVIAAQDGVDCLLRALHHLVYDLQVVDFQAVIAGSGHALPELKALSARLGLDDYIRFTGWVPQGDVARYLSAADVCVAPEPSNALNDRSTVIKLMEYMALGKPIVAFDLAEHRVTADVAGAYATPNDEMDFARQMAALIGDRERRARMGQAGRERVEKVLAWPYQAVNLVAAYERMLDGGASVRGRDGGEEHP